MLKTNKVLVAIAAMTMALGLSACGKEKYQGTYTGYEIKNQSTTNTGTTGYNYQGTFGQPPPRMITVNLTENGDVVTGTYTVNQQAGMYPTGTTPGTQYQETYQFQASAENSGSLSNVTLISTGGQYGSMYSQCTFYQGSLASSNKGQTINGTLTSPTGGATNTMCPSLQISLTRGN